LSIRRIKRCFCRSKTSQIILFVEAFALIVIDAISLWQGCFSSRLIRTFWMNVLYILNRTFFSHGTHKVFCNCRTCRIAFRVVPPWRRTWLIIINYMTLSFLSAGVGGVYYCLFSAWFLSMSTLLSMKGFARRHSCEDQQFCHGCRFLSTGNERIAAPRSRAPDASFESFVVWKFKFEVSRHLLSLEHPRNTKLVSIPVIHGTEGHIFVATSDIFCSH
jgi:hypothetical protein